MPILKDNRKVVEVNLDTIEGGIVKVVDSLLGSDIEKIVKAKDDVGVVLPLSLMIKEWNLTDEEGKPLPITPENISKIDARDLNKISEASKITKDFFGGSRPTGNGTN